MKKYTFNNFSWCYDTVIKVKYNNANDLILVHDHEKILDKIDQNLEKNQEFKDANLLIEKIKNKN